MVSPCKEGHNIRAFPGTDRVNRYTIEETVDSGVDDGDLNFDGDGLAEKIAVSSQFGSQRIERECDSLLTLLEEFGKTRSTSEEETGGSIEIGTELGESSNITVLSEVELERTRNSLHDLSLSGGSYTGDGKSDVDSRSNTLEEEFGFQEDLSITVFQQGDRISKICSARECFLPNPSSR